MTYILKSKTLLFSVLLAVLSVVQGYVALLPLTPVQQMCVGIAIALVVAVLRIVTTQPLGAK